MADSKDIQKLLDTDIDQIAAQGQKSSKRSIKKIMLCITALVLVVAIVAIVNFVVLPNVKYNDAVALMDAGQYEEAIAKFEALDEYKDSNEKMIESKYQMANMLISAEQYVDAYQVLGTLNGYKDSNELLKSIYVEYEVELIGLAEIGEVVFWGDYEQDGNIKNGKEKTEWVVLCKDNNQVLLISKYALDYQAYNITLEDVTWETSSIREWLNQHFIDDAFSGGEKEKISTVKVSADVNPDYPSVNPGNETEDKIFLLSIAETELYLNVQRSCQPTAYAIRKGANREGNCWWWLRTPGDTQDDATDIGTYGQVDTNGGDVSFKGAIRPALWVNLNK